MDQVWKRATLGAMMLLVVSGIYVALDNLPVVTGCGYYNQCRLSATAD